MTEAVQGGNLSSIVRAIAIDPQNADVIYRGTGAAVERSADGGKTFSIILQGGSLPAKADGGLGSVPVQPTWVHQISVSPVDSLVLYAILEGGSWGSSNSPSVWLMRSSDGGASWADITVPTDPYATTKSGLYRLSKP